MGQLERYYFPLSALSLAPSLKERENKLRLICIKCLSRQTCPLRGNRGGIPHLAACKRGGRGQRGLHRWHCWVWDGPRDAAGCIYWACVFQL